MTKNEYLAALKRELRRLSVPDADEVLEEYEQHFGFERADGRTEEETAARLGGPAALAAQFAQPAAARGSAALVKLGLGFAWAFAAMFFALLLGWAMVMAAFTLACAVCAVCLAAGSSLGGAIPNVPYLCSALYALCLAALAVLSAVGTAYYIAFVRALMRSWARFTSNSAAAASGKAVLPALPAVPRLPEKAARGARRTARVALAVFAAAFVLGAVLSMVSAGALEFWHAWGWFGYAA